MKLLSLGCRVTAVIFIAFSCLAASRANLGRGVEADPLHRDSVAPGTDEDTCTSDKIELSGATKRTFKFKCSGTAKLVPVEQATAPGSRTENFENVYQFTPSAGQVGTNPACTGQVQRLSALVPGSSLKKVAAQEAKQVFQQQKVSAQTVFELTIGEAQEQDKHFCYVCTPDTAGSGPGVGEPGGANPGVGVPGGRASGSACTVYVTVPRKVKPPSEEPNGSDSFSPSAFHWLTLSIGGCAVAMVFHL